MKWKNSKDRTGGTVETILETKDIKKTYVFDKETLKVFKVFDSVTKAYLEMGDNEDAVKVQVLKKEINKDTTKTKFIYSYGRADPASFNKFNS